MITKFKDEKRSPYDRPCFIVNAKNEKKHFLTMGTASFTSGITLECRSNFSNLVPHVLIGRFCNLSWDLKFLLGFNHAYKNSVSPYAFHAKNVIKKISAQIENKENLPEFKTCKNRLAYNNHYQMIIGNDVWIGRGATILGGVKIGSGAIIGANSTVTKNIPPYAIVAGNPAQVIKFRFDEETIKKFMSIQWWNWDVEKILSNAYLMDDVENFLEKHYAPELEKISEDETIKQYLAKGMKIFTCVGDFHAPLPLWKRIINGYCKSNLENSVLIIFLGNDFTQSDGENLKTFVNKCNLAGSKVIHGVLPEDGKIFSPYILKNSNCFITTREMISLECMDWIWDTDVKIVSALDDGIFDGEPAVDWDKIFID